MRWLLSQHFGLLGFQEHYTMNVENFTLNKDANDNVFVTFTESPIKTQKHSEEGYDVLRLFLRVTCPGSLKS